MTWLGRLLRRNRLEAELDAELRDHLERQVADYVAAGLPEDQARRRARLEFGGLERAREYCRDARGTRLFDDLAQDVRYGLRILGKSPGFTLVAVASLALGIGANTAIFTLVDSLILRTLPVREPGQLVRLQAGSWTNPIWEQVRERRASLFADAAAFSDTRFDLKKGGEADFAKGFFASGEFFDLVGVPALLGRTLTRLDDQRGGGPEGPAAVLSYAFWQRRFGGAGDVLGRTLSLNGVPFTIVGVTPPGFFGPSVGRSFDVAVPVGTVDLVHDADDRSWLDGRSTWWLEILARLKPGQTVEAATEALRGVQPQIREATLPPNWRAEHLEKYLRENPFTLAPAATGFSEVRGDYERPLLAVMGVVVLVLLIACANLASLLLARAHARRQELSARLALGASKQRLVRQLLTESVLIALPGAVLGLVFAQWGSRLLLGQISDRWGPVSLDVSLHWRVLLFTAILTLATALLFGIAPALRSGRLSPYTAIQGQSARLLGEGPGGVSAPLVVAQVALSLVLVFAAGLFVRTFSRLASVDLGLDEGAVLLVDLDASRSAVKPEERPALFARARAEVAALPGVARAAVSTIVPLSGMGWNQALDEKEGPNLSERERIVWMNAITPDYFAAYGTRLVAGRDFDERDRHGAPPVAVVNRAFVRRFYGEKSALGRVVALQQEPGRQTPALGIVGVVEDAVYQSARQPMEPTAYVPLAQLPEDERWPFAAVAVRSAAGSPAPLARSVVRALERVDPGLSLTVRLLSDQVGATMMRERIVAMLSGFFGALALFLAALGLYGVTAYGVVRRRSEIGVRMALGADARGVVRLVLGRTGRLVAIGIAVGAVLSLGLARSVESLLFGLTPHDPATLAGAALLLLTVGLLAAGLPARRASRIDPAQVLREG